MSDKTDAEKAFKKAFEESWFNDEIIWKKGIPFAHSKNIQVNDYSVNRMWNVCKKMFLAGQKAGMLALYKKTVPITYTSVGDDKAKKDG